MRGAFFLALSCLPAAALMTAGCALSPVYAGGASGAAASLLGSVSVEAIEGRDGWLVRNALRERLAPLASGEEPKYRLAVVLDDDITGFGVRRDTAVTRERRTLRARYQLYDVSTGQLLVDATAGSDAGIDVVSSEYATIAAEDTALERLSQVLADQIIARLSDYAGAPPDTP